MLTVSNLTISSAEGKCLLKDVSMSLDQDERICLTGASGAGKSTLIRVIMGIGGNGLSVLSGDVQLDGKSILNLTTRERRDLCGKTFGFIPQNSMTAFFSNIKIGRQISETYQNRLQLSKKEAYKLARETLEKVNLRDADRVLNAYPSQLSGGMLQRIAMSMILGMKPRYILADEPTSALDISNRAHLIQLLADYQEGGILFISHDIEAIQKLCPVTCVMENGQIIERQDTSQLFSSPQQKWTIRFAQAAERNHTEAERWKKLW